MGKQQDKRIIQQLLATAGITVNGSKPWDIQVIDERFYSRVMAAPDLGLGEAYIDGWWECPSLDEFIYRCLCAKLDKQIVAHQSWLLSIIFSEIKHWPKRLFNQQTKLKALQVGKHHYDIGDDIYDAMLDPSRSYTCAYWKNSTRLEEAQIAKLKLVCEKLDLKPGQRVLDIGCGWGGFAKYAAQNYGVHVTGITISKNQLKYAKNICKDLPVEIRFQDYRDINETFDRICSIGMFEHVGYKNYRHYMEIIARCLADDGLFLLHTIGGNVSQKHSNAWIDKYIFPNGLIPSIAQIGKAYEGLLIMEDWHNFGTDYTKTLLAWYQRFDQHWPTLSKNYSESFKRQWRYYLLSCAGAFRARDLQLWQIVFSKQGIVESYTSIR